MAHLANTKENHRLLNIGDIFKDANAKPERIKNKDVLLENITTIVSNGTPIVYAKDERDFKQLKIFIDNLLLPELKKYYYSSLPPIPEDEADNTDIQEINKDNKHILPKKITNFFIDAAMDPKKFKSKDLTNDKINIIETFASYMDPASRSKPNKTLINEFKKIDSSPSIILSIDLQHYGFNTNCKINLLKGSTEQYMFLEITLKNLYLKCKIDRSGSIIEQDFSFKDTNKEICNFNEINEYFFKGNPQKNKYINENNNDNEKKKNISIMLLLLKELGDTMQAIILEKILDYGKNEIPDFKNYPGTCCLLTNDTVLASRCSMLSVPFLLKNNSILTSYQPPFNDGEHKLIIEKYEKDQKIEEIDRILTNNNNVKESLNYFKKVLENSSTKSIINKELQLYKNVSLKIGTNIKEINNFLDNLIRKTDKAIKFLERIRIILNGNEKTNIKQKLKDIKSLFNYYINPWSNEDKFIKLCQEEFYVFRNYIYQLNVIKLVKKKYKDVHRIKLYGNHITNSLFTSNIPKKLDITNFDENKYKLFKDDENVVFINGFINTLKTKVTTGGGSSSNSSSSSGSSSSSSSTSSSGSSSKASNKLLIEELYMTIYPYIYCYPWLLEYILHEDNSNVKNFIEYVIGNVVENETKRNFVMQLFSSVNEEKYYRISLESNLEKNIQIASLPYDKLLLQESYNSIYNEDNIKKKLLEKIRIVYIDIDIEKSSKKKKTTTKKRKRAYASPSSAASPSSPAFKTKKIKKISSSSPKKIKKSKSRLKGITGIKSIFKHTTQHLKKYRNKENKQTKTNKNN